MRFTLSSVAPATLMALVLALAPACGNKKGGGNSPGETDNPDGVPTDGQAGSLDPRPAACTTCAQALVTTVNGCNATVGVAQPCEGFCFVDPSVTPQWNNSPEAPSSGPAYPDYEFQNTVANINTERVLARGTWVHNLAHGFIVIAYNCPAGCAAEITQIKNMPALKAGLRIIMTEDKALTGARFAAVGWTWVYRFDSVDTTQLDCFIRQHHRHGLKAHTPNSVDD